MLPVESLLQLIINKKRLLNRNLYIKLTLSMRSCKIYRMEIVNV